MCFELKALSRSDVEKNYENFIEFWLRAVRGSIGHQKYSEVSGWGVLDLFAGNVILTAQASSSQSQLCQQGCPR